MSEAASAVMSVLLLATSSLVVDIVFSSGIAIVYFLVRLVSFKNKAFIALVDSVVKEVVSVASPAIRLVVSVVRFAINTFSAVVALVTSAIKSAEPVDDDAST